MAKYAEKVEQEYKNRELTKKEQFRKIQEENLKTAMQKKNAKVQGHVNDSLKEEALISSNPFNYDANDTR